MSPIKFADRSGMRRSDENIKKAIVSNPAMFVQLITVKDGLEELLELRGLIKYAVELSEQAKKT